MSLNYLKQLLVSLSVFACASVCATPLTVDVTGIQSNGAFGDTANVVFEFNIGAFATITSVSYDVSLTAFTPSYLSELSLAFTDTDILNGVALRPGFEHPNPGTGVFADVVDLVANGLSFSVGADGVLRLEFYEGYDDFDGVDGVWNFGTVTFNVEGGTVAPGGDVPEPPVDWLMGAGLALAAYCGRRGVKMSKNIT